MNYYVRQNAVNGDGSKEKPFGTISQAADVALAGDTVWIGGGVYREWVSPARGGNDDEHRITYRSLPGEKPVISGAEPAENWEKVSDHLYRTSGYFV